METKETKLTATQLARSLSDVLNRVQYKGERFIVERNGRPVATLGPAQADQATRTVGDLIELINQLPTPDEDFADDLEAIQASQPPAEFHEWP